MKTLLACLLLTALPAIGADQPVARILFGSCIRQNLPVPILKTVLADRPDLFLFLGDNIYGDSSDPGVLRAKYERLAALPDFARLLERTRVLATWDDHDYGQNDGGADFAARQASQREFTRFWGQPSRSGEGVYDSHIFGPAGRRVQVILLDTRYFRGPLKKGKRRVGGPYYPTDDRSVTMLGEAQWKWLGEQLRRPAELRLIVSSIQCIPEAAGQETWSNIPHERERLFDLLRVRKANGVILLSGDRHWAEISALPDRIGYPLYEFTSSSLNQIHPRGTPTTNRFRAFPVTWHRENYGRISIDWSAADPVIRTDIVDREGKVRLSKTLLLSELQPAK